MIVGFSKRTTNVLASEVLESENAVGAQPIIAETLGSGIAADVYRLSCTAECIRADVAQVAPGSDTRFKVTVIGSSASFVGQASAISPTGGLSSQQRYAAVRM
jgi:hypothetical protein